MLRQIVSFLALLPVILMLSDSSTESDDEDDYFHIAIFEGNEENIIRVCNNERDKPSFKMILEAKHCKRNETPLITAIAHGKLNIAKILILEGANVNAKDLYNETPLHFTTRCRDTDDSVLTLVRMMLSRKADVNAMDEAGLTPLMMACKEGKEYLAIEFLKNGAEVHYEDLSFRTALHYAASMDLKSAVDVLWLKGAKLKKRGWKEFPSQCALKNGHKDIAFILKAFASKRAHLENKTEGKDTALIIAAKNGMENCANSLLAMGADPNAKDKHSNTPTHWTISAGLPDLLESLLLHGCNPNVTNIYGQSPLDVAIVKMMSNPATNSRRLKESLAFTLIEAGVDVPAENSEQLLEYLSHGKLYKFDIPFDDFIMKLSARYSNFAKTRKHTIRLKRLVKHCEDAKNFALYRLLKLWLSQRGMEYVSDLESLKFVIYDELIHEIAKNTYMEKLPSELVSDTLNCANGYYKWKLEHLAWNAALATRYLNAELTEAKFVARKLVKTLNNKK